MLYQGLVGLLPQLCLDSETQVVDVLWLGVLVRCQLVLDFVGLMLLSGVCFQIEVQLHQISGNAWPYVPRHHM